MDNQNSNTSTIIFIVVFIIVSIIITFIIWYISGSVALSLGLLFILFIIGLIIYYFFFAPVGFFGILFGGGGVTNTNCTNPEQQLDEGQYKTCLLNCATTVGNCSNINDLFSCDRKALETCELNTCKSTCFPGKQLFLPLYGIGKPYISTCQNSNGGADLLINCYGGCARRTGTSPTEYCPCMNSNCADIPTTCGFVNPTGWRDVFRCPAQ